MNDKQPESAVAEALEHFRRAKKHEQMVATAVARLLKMAVVTEIGGVVSVSELLEDEIEGPTFGIETSQGQRLFVTVSTS